MKIVHITKKYKNLIGGDTIVVEHLRKQQINHYDSVSILTPNNSEIINADYLYKFGLKLTSDELDRINIKRILSLCILFFYSFVFFKKIKPDIVHSHSIDMGFVCSFACRLYRIPQISTFHCGFYSLTQTITG